MFEGVWTAVVTPFKAGSIDIPSFEQLIKRQIDAGVSGVVVCGTTGEAAVLSKEERMRVLEVAVSLCSGKTGVIVGTGSNDTRATVEMTKMAADKGVDGVLVVAPYYNKPPQEGLIGHFTKIADDSSVPVMIYNVPGRTACFIAEETVLKLAEHPRISALKDAQGDPARIGRIVSRAPTGFSVLGGDDDLFLPVLAAGGNGIVSVLSNVVPASMVKLWKYYKEGDVKNALSLYHKLLPLAGALFMESNPIPVKRALFELGLIENELRLPLRPMDENKAAEMVKILKSCMEACGEK